SFGRLSLLAWAGQLELIKFDLELSVCRCLGHHAHLDRLRQLVPRQAPLSPLLAVLAGRHLEPVATPLDSEVSRNSDRRVRVNLGSSPLPAKAVHADVEAPILFFLRQARSSLNSQDGLLIHQEKAGSVIAFIAGRAKVLTDANLDVEVTPHFAKQVR